MRAARPALVPISALAPRPPWSPPVLTGPPADPEPRLGIPEPVGALPLGAAEAPERARPPASGPLVVPLEPVGWLELEAAEGLDRARPPASDPQVVPLEPVGWRELEAAEPPPRARPPVATMGPAAPPEGVTSLTETGIGVIGFEGLVLDVAEVDDLVGVIPRARGTSVTGVGLEKVLEQGGRAPKAGLQALQTGHGSPDRIRALGRDLGTATQRNLALYAHEADIRPVVREVSEEALRMLDAYINRTDELHPFSTELLAQAFTQYGERMPEVGAKVPIPETGESRSAIAARERVLSGQAEVAEQAAENQIALYEARTAVATEVALAFGAAEIRGTLIDQRM